MALFQALADAQVFIWRQGDVPMVSGPGAGTAAPRRRFEFQGDPGVFIWGGLRGRLVPVLSAATVTSITATTARPRVTITFP
jgi:hypothetical protein